MVFFYRFQAKIDSDPATIQIYNPWGIEISAMGIQSLLTEKKADLVKEWRNAIMASYPKDSQSFLKGKSQFANPVGFVIANEIESLYDELIQEDGDMEKD